MSDSIRGQYEAHGARGYYERFGAEYANPHEAIVAAICTSKDSWASSRCSPMRACVCT